jgi:sec-independent protein translocase protein TatB
MLNIGPGELLAIAVVALLVLGPQRLPDAMRQVGRAVGELRRISGGFQDELRRAMEEADADETVPDAPAPASRPIDVRSTEVGTAADQPEPATGRPRPPGTGQPQGSEEFQVAGLPEDEAAGKQTAEDGAAEDGAAEDEAAGEHAAGDGAAGNSAVVDRADRAGDDGGARRGAQGSGGERAAS